MSEREMRRAVVLAQVKSGVWRLVEAAERIELSYRQTKRLWKRYRKDGAAALVHGSAGRDSNRAKPGCGITAYVGLDLCWVEVIFVPLGDLLRGPGLTGAGKRAYARQPSLASCASKYERPSESVLR